MRTLPRCRSSAVRRLPIRRGGLLTRTLAAARAAEPHPLFVTLSGDLLTHQFTCRFHHLTPHGSPAELAGFAAKTVAFVTQQLRNTFPGIPVYVALGNNDSGCGDYSEDPGDAFLQSSGRTMVAGAEPVSRTRGQKRSQLEALARRRLQPRLAGADPARAHDRASGRL